MARTKTRPRQRRMVETVRRWLTRHKLNWRKMSSLTKLQEREIGERSRLTLAKVSDAPERFRNIQVQEELDPFDDANLIFLAVPLRRRIPVQKICTIKEVILVHYASGLLVAFTSETYRRLCYLNIFEDESIKTFFYNKCDDSLILVAWRYREHNNGSQRVTCRSVSIKSIRKVQPVQGFPLFQDESLKSTDKIEFDEINNKVMIHKVAKYVHKVYDLNNYSLLYSISVPVYGQELIISTGIVVLVSRTAPRSSVVDLKVLSIEDGSEIKSLRHHLVTHSRNIEVMGLFNEYFVVQLECTNLQILNLINENVVESTLPVPVNPSSFWPLYENTHFLYFKGDEAEVWNMNGECITEFEDHRLWDDADSNNTYISRNKDFIISYCCHEIEEDEYDGGIHVSDIRTGKRILRLDHRTITIKPRSRGVENQTTIRSSVEEVLEGMSAIYYDEDRDVLYSGNGEGLVHVWHS